MGCLAGLSNVWCFVPLIQECVSMATLVCAHGPTVLTDPEPSEVVAECIFYAMRHGLYKKIDRLKNIFIYLVMKVSEHENLWYVYKSSRGRAFVHMHRHGIHNYMDTVMRKHNEKLFMPCMV